jgi:serine/threonine-protein kinase
MPGVQSNARTFEVGELLLGKYRVVRPLGEGGMGFVIEAENERTTRRVAIKVLHGGSGARSPGAAQRFQNEARAASRLAHPNSVDVLDFEQDEDGTLFIVQELLRGETLYDRMQREGRMPWRDAFDVMLPVMSALAAAHRAGIVHRDVKPENIFLAEVARGVFVPKIIDFGLARVFNDSYRRVTHMDKVVGTPFYMSPEQAAGDRELTGQTDVWSAGVVLYECVAGHSPFEGDDVKALMLNIAAGRLVPFHERCPSEPADVVRVIERALEPDRAKRYPTMDAFLDEALACVGPNGGGIGRLVASREKSALDSMRPPPMLAPVMSRPDVTAPSAVSSVAETPAPPTPPAAAAGT